MIKAWVVLTSFGLLASTSRIITFDTEALGKAPPGWIISPSNRSSSPRWAVLVDRTAPTQPYVLAQTSNGPVDGKSPLAILDSMSLRDGDVSVRVKPISGQGDRSGGLVWRYRDENNYYLVSASATGNTVGIYKVESGRRTPIAAGVRHTIPLNSWTIVKISARGNKFQVYLDHRRVLEVQDNTFTGAGKVGLSAAADGITYFDDFRVYPK